MIVVVVVFVSVFVDIHVMLLTLNVDASLHSSPSGIVRCSQIVPSDTNGYADPYVSVSMEPAIVEKKSTQRKFKTSVKKKTLNPVFDQIFPFRELEVRLDAGVFNYDDRWEVYSLVRFLVHLLVR